jgi:hypothetical protein
VSVKPRIPLNAQAAVDASYHVYVKYYNQDDIGLTKSTDEIDCYVDVGREGGKNYYKWHDYKIRHLTTGKDLRAKMELGNSPSEPWTAYPPAEGFEYLVDGDMVDEGSSIFKTPDLSSVPKDMEGFRFYTNIIDFHTWGIFKKIFFRGANSASAILKKPGDSISLDMSNMSIPLMDWPNLTSDFSLDGGYLTAEYIGDKPGADGAATPIVFFSQNQRLKQYVYGMAGPIQFKMPYNGSNRFMGFYHPDPEGDVLTGTFNEFVYSRVNAPMLITVIVHSKREYRIERL